MKAKFESDDDFEIKRLAKSKDMALCLWEIVNHFLPECKNDGCEKCRDRINDAIANRNIDVNDLVV